MREMVNKGAKFLDENYKGWYKTNRIKIKTLNLLDSKKCILGQLFKHENDGYFYASNHIDGLKDDNVRRALGFTLFENDSGDPTELTLLWVEEIKKRRKKSNG